MFKQTKAKLLFALILIPVVLLSTETYADSVSVSQASGIVMAGAPVTPRKFSGDLRQLPKVNPSVKSEQWPALSPAFNSQKYSYSPFMHSALQSQPFQFSVSSMPSSSASFKGLDFSASGFGWPPDAVGDVSANHYMQAVNDSVGIFSKTGTVVITATFGIIFNNRGTGTACDVPSYHHGDPLVLYDQLADRWIIADFAWMDAANGPYYECFGVTQSSDLVMGPWAFYAVRTDDAAHPYLADYPKIGLWPDGIYMSANMFDILPNGDEDYKGVRVWAFNRSELESGAVLHPQYVDLDASYFSLLPSNLRGVQPPSGSPNYFVSNDLNAFQLDVWKFHVDWVTPANSTFTGPFAVTTSAYTLPPATVPEQSGEDLDSLGDRLMMQNQYRNLGGAESLWLTHTAGSGGVTGIQWYQLDVTGGAVASSPVQSGIYQPDSNYRWLPSLAVDKDGNMAVGYSVSSSSMYPAIRYAGRLASDPLNTLGQGETTLIAGTGAQTGGFGRWGDYSAMSIDPSDDCTFWYTNEYYETTGNSWQTRIGSFKFSSCESTPPTSTPTNTNTPIPPTDTPTKTNTPIAPTDTPTQTNTPVAPTDTPTKTNTPIPPTDTPTQTNTPVATATPTQTNTPNATAALLFYYVDATNGSNTSGNGSLASPWKTITYALSQVSSPGSDIHVLEGTYNSALGESFPLVMKPGVSLLGAGYATTTIAGSSSAYNPDYSLLYFLPTEAYTLTTVISGFTITNGSQGIRVDGSPTGSAPTLQENWITGNYLGIQSYSISGRQSDTLIKDNLISNNQYGLHSTATDNGSLVKSNIENNLIVENAQAGVWCFSYSTSEPRSACSPTIKNNVIANNSESGIVCAIAIIGYCKPLIIGNQIADNQNWGFREENNSGCCGGTGNADALFINNFIFGNGSGGAYFKDDETPTFINNTIADNHTYGIWGSTRSDAIVINSIVWGQDHNLLTGVGNVSYSDIGDGGYAGINHNTSVNPKFVDAASGDYHLLPNSPVLNAGNNAVANLPATDIDGDPRIQEGTVDMGADETSSTAATPTPTRTNTSIPPTDTPTKTNTPVATATATPTLTGTPTPTPTSLLSNADKIVFVRPQPLGDGNQNSDIWIMQADGSNETQLTTFSDGDRWPALSPDGSKIAYVSYRSAQWTLWVMNSDGTNPVQLPYAGNVHAPTWSTDGNKIAFAGDAEDGEEIWTINADGSNPQRLTTSSVAAGNPAWSPDGSKLVYTYEPLDDYSDLYTVNSDGTGQTLLVSASGTGFSNGQPSWSPDGTQIATIHSSAGNQGPYDLWLMDADGSNGQVLVLNITNPNVNNLAWSQDGNWLTFTNSGHIWTVESDGSNPTEIANSGGWEPDTNASGFSASTPTPTPSPETEKIVFVRPQPEAGADANVWIMNPDGSNETQLTTWNADDMAPVISPDGDQVAYYSLRNSSWTLWVMNSDGTNPVQLAVAGNMGGAPAWSPDGSQIAYGSDSQDWWEIWVVNADGTNPHRVTTHGPAAGHPSWSPDGQKLAYGVEPSAKYLDLYTVNSDGTGQTLIVSASSSGSNHQPAWSPDGTQIATIHWPAGSASGPYDLWLMNADGSNGHTLVQNIDSGTVNNLAWSQDSNWVLFSKGDQLRRIRRDGTGLTQITTAGGWQSDTNAETFFNSNAIVYVWPQAPLNPTDTDTNIWIMDPDGSNQTQLTTATDPERLPGISPDGSKIVYQAFQNNLCTSWVMNRDGTNPIQLQVSGSTGNCGAPAWSPNGQKLAFSSDAISFWEIWVINADGTNPIRLSNTPGASGSPSWSPDGQKLVFQSEPAAKYLDLYTINSDGTGQTLLVSASGTGFSNQQPAWSPDGTQIATIHWTAGSAVGPYDLWLMNADGSNGHVLVSNIDYYDTNNLSWSADSTWLVFGKNGQIWRVRRDGTGLTQITTIGGWEPHTNADTFSSSAPTATPTRTNTPTPTPTRTNTPIPPTATATQTRTNTPIPPTALQTQLMAYWQLEEATGLRVDATGRGNNLSDNNGVGQQVGKIGNAAHFTPANNTYLSVADTSDLSTGDIDFSLSTWVYLTDKSEAYDAYQVILGKGTSATFAGQEYELFYTKNLGVADRFGFFVQNGADQGLVYANQFGAPALNTWYFIMAWHDAGANTVNIQVNDGAVDSVPWSGGSQDTTQEFTLGKIATDPGYYWNGGLDEVGFWKRTLTAAERTTLYNCGSGLTYPFTAPLSPCPTPTQTPTRTNTPTSTPTRTNTPVPPTSTPTPVSSNGSGIVFVRPQPGTGTDTNIWIMNSDGSNQTQLTTWNGEDLWPALSPDGSKITYVSIRNNQQTLWVMNSNGSNPIQLPYVGNVQSPTWSPDGSQITFQGDSVDWWEIWAINADGSNPRRLTTHAGASGAPDWSPDEQKIIYTNEPSAMVHDLYTINSNGTGQSLLISASATGFSNHRPAWSPDGTKIATIHYPVGSFGPYDLWLMNANGSNGQVLVQGIDSPNVNHIAWSADGNSLVFAKSGQIWRVQMNGSNLIQITTTGGWAPDISDTLSAPRPTSTPTRTNTPVPPTPLPSNGSSIVFVWPQAQFDPWNTDTNIWIMNWDGSNRTQLTTSTVPERLPVLSPNGSKIAYQAFINNRCTLWVMNRNGTNPTQLQVNSTSNDCGSPSWSPNGQQLAFSSDAVDWWEIWVINADGSNPHRLTTNAWAAGEPSWSPNGQKLVYAVNPVAVGYEDIYTVNSDGTGQTLLVSNSSGFSNHRPAWSPDGTQIATIRWPAGNNGPYDLWLMNADGSNGHTLVQNVDHPNINHLSWSTDGNWLVFGKNGQIWRVRRDGTSLAQITTTGGWEPHVGPGGSSASFRVYLPMVSPNYCGPLYADDFSNSASGWFIGDSGSVLWQYLTGEYRMLVRDPDWGAGSATSAKFSNYLVAVDVRNPSGSYGTYGLIFGLSDNWSQFYSLQVDPAGTYLIWRYSSGNWTLLTWGTSSAINQGTATNRLKVERNGSLIKVYANDQLLNIVSDGSFNGSRRLGLTVNSYADPNVDIRFDNFKVYPTTCGSISGLSGSGQLSTETSSVGVGQTDPGASILEGPNRLPTLLQQSGAATDRER